MAIYYDSSAILSILFEESKHHEIITLWNEDSERMSSILLEAEVITALRRASNQVGLKWNTPQVKTRLNELQNLLQGLTLFQIDHEIIEILRQNPDITNCRSLDSLHIATALYFQQYLNEPLKLCSLDKRMRQLAATLKFIVIP